MQGRRLVALFGLSLAFISGRAAGLAPAATPSFTISASNATMPASGAGSVSWTLTSLNGYSGPVMIACVEANAPLGARLPICGGNVAPIVYTLTANEVLTGSVTLTASPVPCTTSPCPVKLVSPPRHGAAPSLAWAGVLLLGLGFRRKTSRWFAVTVLTFGMLAALAGMNACGGGAGNTLTPGVWPYTISASDATINESVSTTINVTVPPGIVTNP